jgi:hypothetical protein
MTTDSFFALAVAAVLSLFFGSVLAFASGWPWPALSSRTPRS